MSYTTVSIVPSSTSASTSNCTDPAVYELPIKDAACGIPNNADYKTIFESCAYPATVQPYHSGCALYAPALNQSVQDLIDCLYGARVDWEAVGCTGGTNTTATGKYKTATATPTSTSKSTSTSTLTKESAEETGSVNDNPTGAAAARAPGPGVVALALLCLLLTGSLRAGAL
ncbi:hypothetical protein BDW66DRAFT_149546 [Aspergillus desertorum]